MKNIFKKIFALLLVVCSVLVLVGCGKSDEQIAELQKQLKDAQDAAAETQAELEARVAELEDELEEAEKEGKDLLDLVDAYQQQIAAQKDVKDAKKEAQALLAATMAQFDKTNENSQLAKAIAKDAEFDFTADQWNYIHQLEAIAEYVIKNGSNVEAVSEMVGACCNTLWGFFSVSGAYSYVALDYAERTKILAALEEYAVNKGLTGLTLYSSAGYALYNEGVTLGTETYIVGYGFGAIAEGTITKGLSYEGMVNPDWATYYHTYQSDDPASLNYGDDKGSVVGDLQPMVSGSYWGTKMNSTKDDYVWYNDLALEKPQAVESTLIEGTNLATTYTFKVRIGSALKYATLSEDPAIAAFNRREVAVEDYLVPFKTLWTQKNGWARASDNHNTSQEIVGEKAFYNATKDGFNQEAWDKVGIKAEKLSETEGQLTVTFVVPCNPFYAMYYLSSSIYAPCPQEFMDLVGADHFGKFDTENNRTPKDTILSTGVFVVEDWANGDYIAMKKNALNNREEGRYNVDGVHYDILTAINTDKEAAFKEFMAGKLSACSVPSTQLENFMGKTTGHSENGNFDYSVYRSSAGTTYKLNMNTLDQETWYKFFGENGTITTTDLEDSWECEPIMSDHNFYLGLSYALDRKGLAAKLGVDFSVNYFGDVYLSNPEEGVTYNKTELHANAIRSLIADDDKDGFDVEIARQYFDAAARACLEAGYYEEGDTIEIEIAWQTPSDEKEYHNFIKKCFEDAFNNEAVADGKLTLKVNFWAGAKWSDVYYKKMMVGQFDIGFGSVSGNSLNPINFLEVLKSDNSSGFTLNWGADTSLIDEDLMFDGKIWSFDALWLAADQGGYFENGASAVTVNPECLSVVKNEDGSQTITIDLHTVEAEGVSGAITEVKIFAYLLADNEDGYDYFEDSLAIVVEGQVATCTVSADLVAKYARANLLASYVANGVPAEYFIGDYLGIDVYYSTVIAKIPVLGTKTIPSFIDLNVEAAAPADAE